MCFVYTKFLQHRCCSSVNIIDSRASVVCCILAFTRFLFGVWGMFFPRVTVRFLGKRNTAIRNTVYSGSVRNTIQYFVVFPSALADCARGAHCAGLIGHSERAKANMWCAVMCCDDFMISKSHFVLRSVSLHILLWRLFLKFRINHKRRSGMRLF